MSKVIIATDSCCDLSTELYEKFDIKVLPLYVTLGDKTYFDGVDIKPVDIFKYVNETGILPKTAARSVGDFIDFFKKFVDEGYEVFFTGIGSCLSATTQNARLAAEEVGNVYVVDSENLSSGIALSILKACDLRDQGMSAEKIADVVSSETKNIDASFIIDRLDYLYKGGRCSAVSALGANLLKLHPCIEVKEGKMGVGKKYRGNMKDILVKYVKERLSVEDIKYKKTRVFITHTCVEHPEYVEACVEAIKETGIFENVYATAAGATVSSHCGPNTLGVLFDTEA